MTTFAGWLQDQIERHDEVGQLARLWKEISPGRIHGLAGVTTHLQKYAEEHNATWLPEAIEMTTREFRAWKANPEGSSLHAPAVATQLDRIEHMLRALLDNLGIAMLTEVMTGGPDAAVYVLNDQGGDIRQAVVVSEAGPTLVPVIGPDGLQYVEAGSRIETNWAALYESADHSAAEEETA